MTLEEFVDCFAKERTDLLASYLTPSSGSDVARNIAALGLSEEQAQVMRHIVDGILRDLLYTVLLGLDGAASIGGHQEVYDLRAEDGTRLTGSGMLEVLAYERFHNVA
jgi:hypothetical protein